MQAACGWRRKIEWIGLAIAVVIAGKGNTSATTLVDGVPMPVVTVLLRAAHGGPRPSISGACT